MLLHCKLILAVAGDERERERIAAAGQTRCANEDPGQHRHYAQYSRSMPWPCPKPCPVRAAINLQLGKEIQVCYCPRRAWYQAQARWQNSQAAGSRQALTPPHAAAQACRPCHAAGTACCLSLPRPQSWLLVGRPRLLRTCLQTGEAPPAPHRPQTALPPGCRWAAAGARTGGSQMSAAAGRPGCDWAR